jgi:hypothetical protein
MLGKQAILDVDDAAFDTVNVPEWGGDIRLRTMTGKDRDAFEISFSKALADGKAQNMRAALLVRCICDDAGTLIFSKSDATALGTKSAAALDPLFTAARKLNKMTEEDIADLEGNLDGLPSDSSDSD